MQWKYPVRFFVATAVFSLVTAAEANSFGFEQASVSASSNTLASRLDTTTPSSRCSVDV